MVKYDCHARETLDTTAHICFMIADGHWWPESYYLATIQARQALCDVCSLTNAALRADVPLRCFQMPCAEKSSWKSRPSRSSRTRFFTTQTGYTTWVSSPTRASCDHVGPCAHLRQCTIAVTYFFLHCNSNQISSSSNTRSMPCSFAVSIAALCFSFANSKMDSRMSRCPGSKHEMCATDVSQGCLPAI